MRRSDIAAVFEKYGAAVYRRAHYLLGNHEDAEEATQEVFVRVLESAERFEHRSQLFTWLNRIVTNFCLNAIRNNRRRWELWEEKIAGAGDAVPGAPSQEGMVLMRRLLAEAEEEQARAAIYVFVDGMSHEEAASILGVSRRTVGNLLTRFQRWAEEYLAATVKENGKR